MWKSLSLKLILTFMLVTIGSVGTVSLILSQQVGTALINDGGRLLRTRAEAESRLVATALDTQISHLRSVGISPTLIAAAATHDASYPTDQAATERQISAEDNRWPTAPLDDPLIAGVLTTPVATELRSYARLDQNIAELMFTDRRGTLVAASARTSDYNQGDEEWWQRAAASGVFISAPSFDVSSGSFSIIIAAAIYDPISGAFIGVLRSTYRTDGITLQLAGDLFDESTQANLVIGNRILKPGGSRLAAPSASDARAIIQARSSDHILADYEGLPRLIALAPVTSAHEVGNLDWAVLVYQNRSQALAPVLNAQTSTVVTMLIVLAITAIVAIFIAELISAPMRRITNVSEQIAAGDLTQRVGKYSNDEIGRLARSFDKMATSLQERIDADQETQAERLQIQQSMIDSQSRRIEELTTPTIPLGHGTLLLPLIGSIDQKRAERVLQTVLTDVHAHRAHTLILDLSGLHDADTQVMSVLMRATTGASLIGARVVLVGIRAQTARILADLNLDTSGIAIYANLHDAIDKDEG